MSKINLTDANYEDSNEIIPVEPQNCNGGKSKTLKKTLKKFLIILKIKNNKNSHTELQLIMRSVTDLLEQFKKLSDDQSAAFSLQTDAIKKIQKDFVDFKAETRLLADLMRKIQKDNAAQVDEIKIVQLQIENCAGCQGGVEVENCLNSNPCFPGVECTDSVNGMICGKCPRGHIGDGRNCRRIEVCDDQPCFK